MWGKAELASRTPRFLRKALVRRQPKVSSAPRHEFPGAHEQTLDLSLIKAYKGLVVALLAVQKQTVINLSETARHDARPYVIPVERAAYRRMFFGKLPVAHEHCGESVKTGVVTTVHGKRQIPALQAPPGPPSQASTQPMRHVPREQSRRHALPLHVRPNGNEEGSFVPLVFADADDAEP